METNTQITLANGKIIDVKETIGELEEKINNNTKFIYVNLQIHYYLGLVHNHKINQKLVLININHIALIEPI